MNFVDALKSSGFFFGAGTPWLMYSKVCPGVTWLECLMEFVGSDASHRARIAFCRSRPFGRSGFSISRGARSDSAGERRGDDGVSGDVEKTPLGTRTSLSSESPSWSTPGRLRKPLCLSAFLYFSTSPSHSGSRVNFLASIDKGDPSLSLPYRTQERLVRLRSVVCRW